MTAEAARDLLAALDAHRVMTACVSGGWAVDALLGEQTRRHTDLDLWSAAVELEPLLTGLAACGVDRVLPWPGDRPWNFVLHDGAALRVDLHLYEQLDGRRIHYGSAVTGEIFPADALEGSGTIAGTVVRCETPQWSVRWHTGYPPRTSDRHDVARLCGRFAIPVPDGYIEAR